MKGPEQKPPVETRTNFRVSVEELVPRIKPADPNYQFNPSFSRGAKAADAQVLLGEMINNPDLAEFYKTSLKEQTVVDLGAYTADGYMVACASGAKGYIAAEPFNFRELEENFGKLKEIHLPIGRIGEWDYNKIPYALVNSDAVDLLRRLPPWSVSVMVNALDYIVIPNEDYVKRLRGEIQRVTDKDGACIFHDVYLFDLGPDFNKIDYPKNTSIINVIKYKRKL